jgi:hypothetical protein
VDARTVTVLDAITAFAVPSPGGSSRADIGYALAVSSCKRVSSVDACTVAALDAITAFAVPSAGCSSRAVEFSGLVAQ